MKSSATTSGSMADNCSMDPPSSSGVSMTSAVSKMTLREKLLSFARKTLTSEPRERLRALHDHKPEDKRFLAFKRDDEFELVNSMKDGWWLAKHLVSKKKGLVPSSFVARQCDIELLEWCNLEFSRAEAEKELSKVSEGKEVYASGSFIVRSSSRGNYTEALSLSVKSAQGSIHHYTILRENKQLRIEFHKKESYVEVAFPTLTKLVQHYARYSSAVRQRLTYSLKKKIDAWEIEMSEIEKGIVLGQGNFGRVCEAMLDGRKVAVKSLLKLDDKAVAEFLKEAETARRLSHENIVRIIGVCTKDKQSLYIVTEFLSGRDLVKYLKLCEGEEEPKKTLTHIEFLAIARKIAAAMAHLEQNNIVHRDLAARNVLVGQSLNAIKLADFGLARSLDDKTYYRSQRKEFPYKWTAPEAFVFYGPDNTVVKDGLYTSASDVWSYAVVLWELYSMGAVPYSDKDNSHIYKYLKEDNSRLERPAMCPENTIYKMMRQCWSIDPTKRPTFAAILTLLDEYAQLEEGVE